MILKRNENFAEGFDPTWLDPSETLFNPLLPNPSIADCLQATIQNLNVMSRPDL